MALTAEQESYFSALQKDCLPAVWSKGVSLVRDGQVQLERKTTEEFLLRVRIPGRPLAAKVQIWPGDEDSFCDCEEKAEPCSHVAACVIFLRAANATIDSSPGGVQPRTLPPSAPTARLVYAIRSESEFLTLERMVLTPQGETPLREPLVARMGGHQSGRIPGLAPTVSQEDYAADQVLSQGDRAWGALSTTTWHALLKALDGSSRVEWNGQSVQVSRRPISETLVLDDHKDGFRLSRESAAETSRQILANTLCVQRNGEETFLHPWIAPPLGAFARESLKESGWIIPFNEADRLVMEVLPELESKIPVKVQTKRLPKRVTDCRPKLVFQTEVETPESLSVLPRLVYVDQDGRELGEIIDSRLEISDRTRLPVRNFSEEKDLQRTLREKLQLSPRQRRTLQGQEALRAGQILSREFQHSDSGTSHFRSVGGLKPRFHWHPSGRLEVFFDHASEAQTGKTADPARVLRAWRENESAVPLLEGGFSPLPVDWLSRYGESLERLLRAREDHQGHLPKSFAPEISELWETTQTPLPDPLQKLRTRLESPAQLPEVELPSDLTASLRPYQREGVRWLEFLKSQDLGACLADDMGLGKTLQALCVVQGRTLIVAPTSVVSAWEAQIRKFRPSLTVGVYRQAGRNLKPDLHSVTLTTYGILRLDQDALSEVEWDTVILDEAQTIRNPESQVARAAHRLKARFRMALSGTPIENRLEDLWSLFRFLHPGFLGSKTEFQEEWSQPISRGDAETAAKLHRKVRPFLLRRLKREVAHDLPPRTEIVLEVELSQTERDVYRALEASTRKEVLESLGQGQNPLSALEALLRLRQACCHAGLLPGHSDLAQSSSSKLELLLESLQQSISAGHRSLVFSQWTSLLDRVESVLQPAGITFLRIDGSTGDRGAVVEAFQKTDGPPVMLLSLGAGGTGLTLTAADHVYILDPWWNPAVEDQAADRSHRIGQENPVLIHRLVARETVEERILQLQAFKRTQAQAVLAGKAGQSAGSQNALSREELLALILDTDSKL